MLRFAGTFRYLLMLFQKSIYVSISVVQSLIMDLIGCSMTVAIAIRVAGTATSAVIIIPRMPKSVIMFLKSQ